ncbi:AAA domain-containing protein [Phocaeicola vulgatus]|uniref:AAA domain-containing protein n=1 Tax=Phocaeicola vulgatus TaxID=821 RepID=A0AAE4IAH6_PHOVU|nr:AAA domain-containing protein [Phocaeicola vulgatus]MDU0241377.1 AAA domain-containing protein [Phocaeicola vulgatus]
MRYNRKQYQDFLSTEIETQVRSYEQIVNTKAMVLKDRGDVFVGMFIKINEQGFAIFKVRESDKMPRKNSFWTAVYYIDPMSRFRQWGDLSWLEIREKYQKDFSDAYCCWLSKSEDEGFCLVGFKNITVEFANLLTPNTIVAFGPNDPPLQYLKNLLTYTESASADHILDAELNTYMWKPTPIEANENSNKLLLEQLDDSCHLIIQGPPGTGKTYRMANLAKHLLDENKSVLVTALTNQALMELAAKEALEDYIKRGRVSKTSLTIDEARQLNLQKVNENKCNPIKGELTLASFYVSSGWPSDESAFDYVIMDEASQALYPMIAVSFKLGKKVVWVGDQKQLPPIVLTNEDIINGNNWKDIVNGFNTLCNSTDYKSFLLKDTFRLTKRGAECTGVFYDNLLHSVSEYQTTPTNISWINHQGGPMMEYVALPLGEKAPEVAIHVILSKVKDILATSSKASIAVLCKFKDSIRALQKAFVLGLSVKELPDNIKIETVDRVQGLTIDYCFFLIPNVSTRYSLQSELFNVATSRARYNTIIVADKLLLKENMSEDVRKYLLKASNNSFVSFAKTISAGSITLTVKDKIDLSKFEKKRAELVNGKENIYIIDTNVFVNCPDIISKIGKKYKIIIPSTVLEELDKLKIKEGIDKITLSKAAKNISMAFTQQYSCMEDANVSLLPNGFDRKNPDCKILSVALKHSEENSILLTSDNMLAARAKGLGITTITLKDFLRR